MLTPRNSVSRFNFGLIMHMATGHQTDQIPTYFWKTLPEDEHLPNTFSASSFLQHPHRSLEFLCKLLLSALMTKRMGGLLMRAELGSVKMNV